MNVIRVATRHAGASPRVASDFYLPFDITWTEAEQAKGPSLYARYSGIAGGELEFGVDADTGELRGLVCIFLGATSLEPPPSLNELPTETAERLLLDTNPWTEATKSLLEVGALLRHYRLQDGVRIDFNTVEPTELVVCSPQVSLALTSDGTLGSLVVRGPIADHHFQT